MRKNFYSLNFQDLFNNADLIEFEIKIILNLLGIYLSVGLWVPKEMRKDKWKHIE